MPEFLSFDTVEIKAGGTAKNTQVIVDGITLENVGAVTFHSDPEHISTLTIEFILTGDH